MDGQRNVMVVYINMCKVIPGDDGGKITADEIDGKIDTVNDISDDTDGEIDTVDEISGNVDNTDDETDTFDDISDDTDGEIDTIDGITGKIDDTDGKIDTVDDVDNIIFQWCYIIVENYNYQMQWPAGKCV